MDEKEKQVVICRQSQLKFVMDYSKQIGKPLKLKEMVRNKTLGKIDDYLQKLFENE